MVTFLFFILFLFVLNGLLYAPLFIRRQSVRRAAKLQVARTELAACAEAMQNCMLNRQFVSGDLIHDINYEAINSAQYFEKYISLAPLLSPKRQKEAREIKNQIQKNHDQAPAAIQRIEHRFLKAYMSAAYYRQPVLFVSAVVYALVRGVFKHTAKLLNINIRHLFRVSVFLDPRVAGATALASWLITAGVINYRTPQDHHHKAKEHASLATA